MEVRQLARLRPAAVTQWTKARFNKETNSRWPAKSKANAKANGKWPKLVKFGVCWANAPFPLFSYAEKHTNTHTEWEHTMHKATSRRLPCLAGKIHTHTLTQANMHFDSWHIRYESVYRRLGCRAFPLTLWTQRSAWKCQNALSNQQ